MTVTRLCTGVAPPTPVQRWGLPRCFTTIASISSAMMMRAETGWAQISSHRPTLRLLAARDGQKAEKEIEQASAHPRTDRSRARRPISVPTLAPHDDSGINSWEPKTCARLLTQPAR